MSNFAGNIFGRTWVGAMPGPAPRNFITGPAATRGMGQGPAPQMRFNLATGALSPDDPRVLAIPQPQDMQPAPMPGRMPAPAMMPAPRERKTIMGAQASPSFGAADRRVQPPPGVSSANFRRFADTPGFVAAAYGNEMQQQRDNRMFAREDQRYQRGQDDQKAAKAEAEARALAGMEGQVNVLHSLGHLTDDHKQFLEHVTDPKQRIGVLQQLAEFGGYQAHTAAQLKAQQEKEAADSITSIVPMAAPDGSGMVPMMKTKAGMMKPAGSFMPTPRAPLMPDAETLQSYQALGLEPTYLDPATGAMHLGRKLQSPPPAKPRLLTQPQPDGTMRFYDPTTGEEVKPKGSANTGAASYFR